MNTFAVSRRDGGSCQIGGARLVAVEVSIAAVTTGCVNFFGVLQALVVAVGLSIIDTVRRSARPHDAVLGWVEPLGRESSQVHPVGVRTQWGVGRHHQAGSQKPGHRTEHTEVTGCR